MREWLTLFLCVSAATGCFAQDIPPIDDRTPQPGINLPMFTTCSQTDPADMLLEQYDELPFVDGKGSIMIPDGRLLPGTVRVFMHPQGATFSVIISTDNGIHCMLTSGESMQVSATGDSI